jgi:hypothetical protein
MRRSLGLLCVAVILGACGGDNGPSENKPTILYGVTSANQLVSFDATDPAAVTTRAITGLAAGDDARAIDFRPLDGSLYLLTDGNSIYTVNTSTGAATQVGTDFTPALDGVLFGFDFNPVVDRLRVVTNNDQNFRLDPSTGAVAGSDSELGFAVGDVNEGEDPSSIGAAYTNNEAGAASTALFMIDDGLDALLSAGANPNLGFLTTVGGLGINAAGDGGFDIAKDGTAYAALVPNGTTTPNLYTINLSTGAATLVGAINSERLLGLSAKP